MHKLVRFWVRRINPQLATLVAAIGTIGLFTCLAILLGLSWLFQEVLEKEAFEVDTTVLLGVHQWANPVLDRVMLSVTRFGDPEFVVVVVALSLGLLLWRRQRTEAKMFVVLCLGAFILNQGLKLFFVKPRPQLWTPLITETSFSFPSGHALGSLALYGFLAYLLAIERPKLSYWIYSFTSLLVSAIGFSRLYLGVHWFTDIVAGYAVGFLWLMICITMLKFQVQNKTIKH
ncbi:phosphatase PAP2 family protein [Phormidesmis priestleyi]